VRVGVKQTSAAVWPIAESQYVASGAALVTDGSRENVIPRNEDIRIQLEMDILYCTSVLVA
jgi:hypothetical protein